ncbi:MAG: M20 family metallo-hydrolase [Candidatus Korarchaeum sp.]|nr:M20 family metallo-hydrolase [Candidatus Korarchaeum sp.]
MEELRGEMVSSMLEMIPLKGIGPENGGDGELRKAQYLQDLLESMGFDVERFDSRDVRVPSGIRPNLVVRYPGGYSRSLWVVSHMDVVPPGSGWDSDPFSPLVREGRIYGRGAEDNGQAIISSIYGLKAIHDLGLEPEYGLNLAIVSDEETGSEHGVKYLLSQGVFRSGDMALVPDAGNSEGTMVEVAEKGILWLKVRVKGKQAHASTPNKGMNASRVAMKLALALDDLLHSKFSSENKLFDPPRSTFEPTKRESKVENINTIPGEDVSYFDCRVLPEYELDEVLNLSKQVCETFKGYGVDIELSVVERSEPSFTDPSSEVVERLRRAIKLLRGKEAFLMGIGGGTCASHLRRAGIEAAVWMTTDETAHQPNEYCVVDNLVEDAKVIAALTLPDLGT